MLSIRPADNTVVVGPHALLEVDEVSASAPVWTSGRAPATGFRCAVQLRAHGSTSTATIELGTFEPGTFEPGTIELAPAGNAVVRALLDEPQAGIAAGQAMVLYDGDEVIGSATVETATRRSAAALDAPGRA